MNTYVLVCPKLVQIPLCVDAYSVHTYVAIHMFFHVCTPFVCGNLG